MKEEVSLNYEGEEHKLQGYRAYSNAISAVCKTSLIMTGNLRRLRIGMDKYFSKISHLSRGLASPTVQCEVIIRQTHLWCEGKREMWVGVVRSSGLTMLMSIWGWHMHACWQCQGGSTVRECLRKIRGLRIYWSGGGHEGRLATELIQ